MNVLGRLLTCALASAGLSAAASGCGDAAAAPALEVEVGDVLDTVQEAMTRNAITPAESREVLDAIDTVCGDTWCDGDYDFRFRRLACDATAHTCTLLLQVLPREGVASSRRSYFRSCKTRGFSGLESLLSTAPNGYRSLAPGYYEALTACTGRIVEQLESRPAVAAATLRPLAY